MAALLRARYLTLPRGYQIKYVAKALIAVAGSLHPSKLRAAHVTEVDEQIKRGGFAHATRHYKSNCLRQILRWLWEEHGAQKLDAGTSRYPGLRPRNVTATNAEVSKLMELASPHLRLWLLLCSDLAIRSGTAAAIGPQHFNAERKVLRFTTKYGAHLTLPITDEIAVAIGRCSMESDVSFVRQLQLKAPKLNGKPLGDSLVATQLDRQYRDLLKAAGITRRITPHDLRRTTAVSMLEETGDIRDVQALLGHRSLQSTVWYLDHDLRPVKRSTLERIKRPAWRKEQSA